MSPELMELLKNLVRMDGVPIEEIVERGIAEGLPDRVRFRDGDTCSIHEAIGLAVGLGGVQDGDTFRLKDRGDNWPRAIAPEGWTPVFEAIADRGAVIREMNKIITTIPDTAFDLDSTRLFELAEKRSWPMEARNQGRHEGTTLITTVLWWIEDGRAKIDEKGSIKNTLVDEMICLPDKRWLPVVRAIAKRRENLKIHWPS